MPISAFSPRKSPSAHTDGQTKLAVRLNRGRRSAGGNYPEPARHLHDARGGPLHLLGRCPATHQRASGQARPRTYPARVEVTLRSRSLAIGTRAPKPRPTTLSPGRQERPRLPAYAQSSICDGATRASSSTSEGAERRFRVFFTARHPVPGRPPCLALGVSRLAGWIERCELFLNKVEPKLVASRVDALSCTRRRLSNSTGRRSGWASTGSSSVRSSPPTP